MAWLFPCLLMAGWQNHQWNAPMTDPKMQGYSISLFADCISGPGSPPPCGCQQRMPHFDVDGDGDMDLRDWAELTKEMGDE